MVLDDWLQMFMVRSRTSLLALCKLKGLTLRYLTGSFWVAVHYHGPVLTNNNLEAGKSYDEGTSRSSPARAALGYCFYQYQPHYETLQL